MLDEYFSISITSTGHLESLPLLLQGFTPDLNRLPHFLLCLGTRVDWSVEKQCFSTFLRELAFFYSPRLSTTTAEDQIEFNATHPEGDGMVTEGNDDAAIGKESEEDKHRRWQLEHVLWPSMRRHTAWTKDSLSNGDLKQVANLPDLFRIFERC